LSYTRISACLRIPNIHPRILFAIAFPRTEI